MKNNFVLISVAAATLFLSACTTTASSESKPIAFGGQDSIDYSQLLWIAMKSAGLVGPKAIADKPYKGVHPHGGILETITSSARVDGHKGVVIVKRTYAGEDVSTGTVSADRNKYLKAVTVMFKREKGYDSDNQDWFWAKYKPDGSLDRNPAGMALAGRVAKGQPKGCISCHKVAPGGDYRFLN